MRQEREKAARKQRNLISVAIVIVVAVLIGLGAWGVKAASDDDAAGPFVAPAHVTDDWGVLYTPEIATGEAPKTDPVVVQLYEDFVCPGCGALEQSSASFLEAAVQSGEIAIDYRPFSFLHEQSTNDYSQRAMNAAMCVLDEGGVPAFVAMHSMLFQNQPAENTAGPDDRELLGLALQAGVSDIDSCVHDQKFTPWVERAKSAGEKAGVSGTPTVRVGGKDVQGPVVSGREGIPGPTELQAAIDAAKAS